MKTIKLSDAMKQLPVAEAVKNLYGSDTNGALSQFTMDRIAAVAGEPHFDGVWILYHRKIDNYPICSEINNWTALEKTGEMASGVLVVERGKHLLIAPTESTEMLAWSTAEVSGGGTTTSDRLTALDDWNGKLSTTAQIKHAECNPETVAPGFCAAYTRPNANGEGLTAGKWWLPSMAEMMMIFANKKKINAALSVINGATKLLQTPYWTSTELSAKHAWYLSLRDGNIRNWVNKVTDRCRVRAVSEFIE